MDPPKFSARDSYDACVRGTRDPHRRSLLLAAGDSIEAAGGRFRQAAQRGALHELKTTEFVVPGIAANDATRWVYENGMVNTVEGRAVYDRIMAAPTDERCPLCGHGVVRTLDHFLPKKMFPALCVDPLNLVPACADCNHAKGERLPSCAETTPLHPYLDRIEHDPWLAARIVDCSPLYLDFFVNPPCEWEQVLVDRTAHHFNMFKLAELFATQANRTINNIRQQLTTMLATGGPAVVSAYLSAEAATRRAHRLNSWEGVTYQTLACDETFCTGAFIP
ncbi:HNH endonuclease [Streptomyces sp. H39-S7]|uniref:HNH endonuclease n=1 Tax=Streptomyces sp. H39-S7 TaxID=3004357 RepID=UPI0022B02E16|nr:HNH endonuclease signature motif containing protein [Streptomyces sp. H39-S7]MCZ4120262.1 HNH endonuclease signature motif containing protein [Streptomyces sp. H39-S7]